MTIFCPNHELSWIGTWGHCWVWPYRFFSLPRMSNTSLWDQPSRLAKTMIDGNQTAGIIIIIVLLLLRKSCNKCTVVSYWFLLGNVNVRVMQQMWLLSVPQTTQQNSMVTHHQGRKLSHISIRCCVLNYLRSDRIKLLKQKFALNYWVYWHKLRDS